MPKHASRIDRNQPEIVASLRACGASVTPTHNAGQGFPDLAVGFRGKTFLLEIKDEEKPPSARKLTVDQVRWHGHWLGHKAVVCSVAEALEACGIEVKENK